MVQSGYFEYKNFSEGFWEAEILQEDKRSNCLNAIQVYVHCIGLYSFVLISILIAGFVIIHLSVFILSKWTKLPILLLPSILYIINGNNELKTAVTNELEKIILLQTKQLTSHSGWFFLHSMTVSVNISVPWNTLEKFLYSK